MNEYDLIVEYKRLLQEAVNDIRWLTRYHDPCELCALRDEDGDCPQDTDKGIDCDDIYKWRLEDESLKLISDTDIIFDRGLFL